MAEKFDVIVIGSGLGGLTAASILTQLKGKRVLVLEKHYVAGGQTHEFHRNQYSWDVGIHYVGGVAPGEQSRLLFDLVTGKQVQWNAMPDVYDRLMFPDMTIDVHKDPQQFAANLIAKFPTEQKAIRQYIKDLQAASNWYISDFLGKVPDRIAQMKFAIKSIGKGNLARMTTQQYMDRNFKDARLKAVLCAQWGDYGVEPKRSSFGTHALIVWSDGSGTGAFFPEGGGSTIARAAEKVIGLQGGRIQVDTVVREILIENGAAYGVRVRESDGRDGEYFANTIISNVGAELTYNSLVPAKYCQPERAEIATLERGTSLAVLYIGLSGDPRKMGFEGENYWLFESFDIEGSTPLMADMERGRIGFGFLSFPSLKNNAAHGHTAEVCIAMPQGFYDKHANRGAAYYKAKDKIAASIIALLERKFPGFGEMVDYTELSTSLTMEHYTGRPRGEQYGIAGTPARFGLKSLRAKTTVKNLFLSGSDVCSLGIGGALNGGAAAAAAVMGPFGFIRLMIGANIAARKPAPVFAQKDINANMLSGVLVDKKRPAATVVELQIKADLPISFRAGQHVDLQVTPEARRSYSVLSVVDDVLTLVIDTKPGGPGSQFAETCKIGDEMTFTKPKGTFLLRDANSPVCFLATGTGMVPLAAMLADYNVRTSSDHTPDFIFGTTKRGENYMPDYLDGHGDDVNALYCLSREETVQDGEFKGRITHLIAAGANGLPNLASTDFYLCGNPNMVQDAQRLLQLNGAKQVFVEYY